MLDTHARIGPRNGFVRRIGTSAFTRAVGGALSTTVAVSVWCVVLAVGGAFSLAGRGALPPRFSYDAAHIARIARSGLAEGKGDQSFTAVGELYNILGLQSQPVLVALVTFAVLALLHTLVLTRLRIGGRVSIVALALLIASFGIGCVYLTTYAKDSVVLAATAVCLLAAHRLTGEIQLVVALGLYAACFRSYWVLVVVIYIALRLADRYLRWHRLSILVPPVAIVAAALVYAGLTGQPLDGARTLANSIRLDSPDARTMITQWVLLPQPWGSVVNILLTLVLLVLPVPLLALGSAYYVAIALLLAVLWVGVVIAWLAPGRAAASPLATRCLALLLAFLATQAVFEPDYGSALRHLSPLLPLLAAGVGLVARRPAVLGKVDVETTGTSAMKGRHSA